MEVRLNICESEKNYFEIKYLFLTLGEITPCYLVGSDFR